MTPELPRAPISDPWAMALQVAAQIGRLEAGQLVRHRLEGQGHVGARVAVGHRVDVETVDDLLMGAQPVAEGGHDWRSSAAPSGLRPPWPGC